MEMEKRKEMEYVVATVSAVLLCVWQREGLKAEWVAVCLGFQLSAVSCFIFFIKVPTHPLSIQIKRLKMKRPKIFFQPKTCSQALLHITELATQKQGLELTGQPRRNPPGPNFFRVFRFRIISGFRSQFCVQNPKFSGSLESGFGSGQFLPGLYAAHPFSFCTV